MNSELNIFYLEDGTIAGTVDTVFQDLSKIIMAVNTHGLQLNPTKCEIFLVDSANDSSSLNATNVINRFSEICPGIKITEKQTLSLLGAPIFPEAVNSILEPKLENLKLMTSRLHEIDNHEALFLLQHCFSIPKLTYFLRASPCFMVRNILENVDTTIKES